MKNLLNQIFSCGALVFLAAFNPACQGEGSPSVGSETHFLKSCGSDDACGEGLACICGACTELCEESKTCEELSDGAVCAPRDMRPLAQSCGDQSVEASCEIPCSAPGDCNEEHVCDRGLCRQRSEECATGNYSPDEIILLGDRLLSESGQIAAKLDEIAVSVGMLDDGDRLRDYSSGVVTPFGGAMDLNSQYESALDEGAARVVVMDSGGPDALLDCDPTGDELCPSLQNAIDGTRNLFSNFANNDTEHVVLFFYPTPDEAPMEEKFDLLRPLMESECRSSMVPCHFVDLREVLDENRSEYLTGMGLFPTEDGSEVAAGAIWTAMQLECIVP